MEGQDARIPTGSEGDDTGRRQACAGNDRHVEVSIVNRLNHRQSVRLVDVDVVCCVVVKVGRVNRRIKADAVLCIHHKAAAGGNHIHVRRTRIGHGTVCRRKRHSGVRRARRQETPNCDVFVRVEVDRTAARINDRTVSHRDVTVSIIVHVRCDNNPACTTRRDVAVRAERDVVINRQRHAARIAVNRIVHCQAATRVSCDGYGAIVHSYHNRITTTVVYHRDVTVSGNRNVAVVVRVGRTRLNYPVDVQVVHLIDDDVATCKVIDGDGGNVRIKVFAAANARRCTDDKRRKVGIHVQQRVFTNYAGVRCQTYRPGTRRHETAKRDVLVRIKRDVRSSCIHHSVRILRDSSTSSIVVAVGISSNRDVTVVRTHVTSCVAEKHVVVSTQGNRSARRGDTIIHRQARITVHVDADAVAGCPRNHSHTAVDDFSRTTCRQHDVTVRRIQAVHTERVRLRQLDVTSSARRIHVRHRRLESVAGADASGRSDRQLTARGNDIHVRVSSVDDRACSTRDVDRCARRVRRQQTGNRDVTVRIQVDDVVTCVQD